jgi:predicted lipoprotein with Yx(FWY)xxD motif
MTHPTSAARFLAGAGAALLLAGCSTSGYVPANQASPVGPITGSAPVAGRDFDGTLATATTPVGTVVTSNGFTLYRFDKDSSKPSSTACVGACARTWPPVLGDGLPVTEGLPPNMVGTVGRPDGTQQLTFNGWPLYRFSKDAAPGDAKGEGVGGTWRAIGVDGKPVAAKPAAAPAGG